MFSVIGLAFAIMRTFLEEVIMRITLLFLLFLSVGCNDSTTKKTNNLNNTNNSNLTPAFCEAIQDWETCNQEGCVAIRTTFDIVDKYGNCIKKLFHGNMCVYGTLYTSNNCESVIYYKYITNEFNIGFDTCSFSQLNGWTKLSVPDSYCCRMDPEGCAETPWVDATDQWYPFDGLLE